MRNGPIRRWQTAGLAALLIAGCDGSPTAVEDPAPQGPAGPVERALIDVRVATAPEALVTAGSALLELRLSEPERATASVALVNGRPAAVVPAGHGQEGRFLLLAEDLPIGEQTLTIEYAGTSAALALESHSRHGPIFSGPHQVPFICESGAFRLDDGSYLPPSSPPHCEIPTVITYVYKSEIDGRFRPLSTHWDVPVDAAFTRTSSGVDVPFIVRIETGSLNRGIYQFAVLHNPSVEEAVSLQRPPAAWNGRAVYLFGGGCGGMYRQGSSTENVLNEQFIGAGYLTMSHSLNVFRHNCNDVLAAESMLMTREQAMKRVGTPVYTLGWGCSGGAHQALQTAANYPGLLDGVLILCSSVDHYRLIQHTTDLHLLKRWFETPAAAGLTDLQRTAIAGTPLNASAQAWTLQRAVNCPDVIAASDRYHPADNPQGIRCSQDDSLVHYLGRDPGTGHAGRTLDNVGVQYGLAALQSEIIDFDTFIRLNREIGGFDGDGEPSLYRSVADERAVQEAYLGGRVLWAGGPLAQLPILEIRNYSDHDEAATHLKYSSFVLRERLRRDGGSVDNHVLWIQPHRHIPYSSSSSAGDPVSHQGIALMDEWLTALASSIAEPSPGALVAARPSELADNCFGEDGTRHPERQAPEAGRHCEALFPTYLPPRMVAGGPMENDVLKCRLRAVDFNDYPAPLADEQRSTLLETFPDGVCDWSVPGVRQGPPRSSWQRY